MSGNIVRNIVGAQLDSTGKEWRMKSENSMPIRIQHRYEETFNFYLQITQAEPNITVNTTLKDRQITVDSINKADPNDVITIIEGSKVYQSLIMSASNDIIFLASPLDFAFSTDANVRLGKWNLSVNGSVNQRVANLYLPETAVCDIVSINISMSDGSTMNSSKFGGLGALVNGVLFRKNGGNVKNLELVVNNIGFFEQGFDIAYDEKPPAGKHGFYARKNYLTVNDAAIRLDGASGDNYQCVISDNLRGLDLLAINVNGHVVTE